MPAMADEQPLPGHSRDGAAAAAAAIRPDADVAPEAISPTETALLEAQLSARRSLAEGLRDVLALPAFKASGMANTFEELSDPDKILHNWKRCHRRMPGYADLLSMSLIATALQCGRQTVAAFREVADRLDGPVTQRVMLSITPEQAERMSDEELSAALKRAGLLSNGAPN